MGGAFAVIGVDIGTSSARAVAYARDGQVLASEAREYPLRSPLPGRAEQDLDEVLEAVLDSLARVARACEAGDARVSGIAFSAAMHSLIGLDSEGRQLAATSATIGVKSRALVSLISVNSTEGSAPNCLSRCSAVATPAKPPPRITIRDLMRRSGGGGVCSGPSH